LNLLNVVIQVAVLLMAVAARTQAQSPFHNGYPYANSGSAPALTANQYHSQDELGQASIGYAHPGQAATNYRDALGNQVGSYAYINPGGKEIRVSYVADSNGFRVLSDALPEGPAPLNAALPALVQDTHEVSPAKAEHAKAWNADLAAAESFGSRKMRQVFAYGAPLAHPFRYSALPLARSALPLAHSAHPYSLAPYAAVHALPAVAPTPASEATIIETVLTPGHAVSYRYD
jgi:Insect cuticle protein